MGIAELCGRWKEETASVGVASAASEVLVAEISRFALVGVFAALAVKTLQLKADGSKDVTIFHLMKVVH